MVKPPSFHSESENKKSKTKSSAHSLPNIAAKRPMAASRSAEYAVEVPVSGPLRWPSYVVSKL